MDRTLDRRRFVAGSAALTAALVAAGVSYGGDGPGSTTFSLQITNDGSSGVETTEGVAINLVQLNDSTILGIVDGTDTVAFAMSIDGDGNVTLEQYLSLNHPDANDPNDALQLAEGSIGVVVTAIDADGQRQVIWQRPRAAARSIPSGGRRPVPAMEGGSR